MDSRLDHAPDFSDGDQFLAQLRETLHGRQRRSRWVAGAGTAIAAGLLFMFSFTALEEQHYRDIWEDYLMSEMSVDDPEVDRQAEIELYLNWLISMEDFDELLAGIYDLGLEDELIFAYQGTTQ